MARVGVDAGGTFTDICVKTDDGRIVVFKTPSTPEDPSRAIVDGASAALMEAGIDPDATTYFGHGTTVATNALLEGRGTPVGVITTQGFRDLLDLGRQQRPDLYDLQIEKPQPLARRRDRIEVPERMRFDGTVEIPLDENAVREAAETLASQGLEAVAITFLYSYLYPQHEQRAAEIVREVMPNTYLSLSHQVLAEFREYERLSSTVVNSYIGPIVSRYVRRLRERVEGLGAPVDPYITQSNGGIISLDVAAETPVRTVLSGPAAGVVGAAEVARQSGHQNIITFDMGGTSSDVSLLEGGEARIGLDMSVAGYPIRAPMIDINTVGAGGGSIAWIDSGGHLKVGPQSAGAVPGPAGYGHGGTEATVTDANLALGILNRESLLGGRMPVDAAAADRAIANLADQLNLEPVEVARGILSIVTVNMARAIRVISIERGHDPRDFTLVAFGGAGPLHAARLARELEIPRVLVPPAPGILCAIGLLVSDLRSDFSRTAVLPAEESAIAEATRILGDLSREASAWLDREGISHDERILRTIVDMRYAGQNYELPIEIPGNTLRADTLPAILKNFDLEHDRSYGFAAPGEPAQFVTFRVEARGKVPATSFPELESSTTRPQPSAYRSAVVDDTGFINVPVYDRTTLLADQQIAGPAIVEQMDSTTVILSGQMATVDRIGNLVIEERTQHS